MALRKLNLNIRNVFNIGLRLCSSSNIVIPEDVTICNIKEELEEFSPIALKKDENKLMKELKNDKSFLFTPAVPHTSQSVAAFVPKSESLQKLIKLGVDLSKVERNLTMMEYLLRADFKQDLQPYILFLYDHKVLPEDMGKLFTIHPEIFKEPMEKLKLRIHYFKTKDFSEASIARIVSKQPSVLTTSTLITDKQLGFMQKLFDLNAMEVREVVTKYPTLIVWDQNALRDNRLYMLGTLGFEPTEVKDILFKDPKLLVSGKFTVADRFDYLHNTIGLSHESILQWPAILRTRKHIVKQRHQFLKFLGKDQFNRKLENYVSMKALVEGSDSDFCDNVAKVPVQMYNDYMKSNSKH